MSRRAFQPRHGSITHPFNPIAREWRIAIPLRPVLDPVPLPDAHQTLRPMARDITDAEAFRIDMGHDRDFDALERHWEAMLDALGRAWNRFEMAIKAMKRSDLDPWLGGWIKFREADPLIAYVFHARNEQQHSLEPLSLDHLPPRVENQFDIPAHGVWYIERMTSINGTIAEYHGNAPLRRVPRPGQIRLRPVTDRGVVYEVPTSHCKLDIPPHPLIVARLAVEWYAFALNAASERLDRGSGRWAADSNRRAPPDTMETR